MHRAQSAALTTAVFAVLVFFVGCGGGGSASSEQVRSAAAGMNVVVVLFDAAAASHFSFLGYARETTPHLDAVAREAIVFENAYAQASATPLSVFSMFTSRYPIPDDEQHERSREGEVAPMLLPGLPTIASRLGERVPHRAAFVSNQWISTQLGYDEGFTEFHELWRTGEGRGVAPFTATEVTDAVLTWLQARPTEPFFAYVHYFEPHAPYQPPAAFASRFDPDVRGFVDGSMESLVPYDATRPVDERVVRNAVALYDGNLAYADAELGRLLEELRASGQWDNTVFVFLSDHGEAFWQHGKRGHGVHIYEEYVRVPFLIRVPGAAPAGGRRVTETVQLVDVMPTLLELAGIGVPPRTTAGRSLVDLMAGAPPVATATAFLRNHEARQWEFGLRQGRFKFIYNFDRKPNELYDLQVDARETVNMLESSIPPRDYDLETVTRALWEDYKRWVAAGHGVDAEIPSSFAGVDSLDPETVERLRAIGYFN